MEETRNAYAFLTGNRTEREKLKNRGYRDIRILATTWCGSLEPTQACCPMSSGVKADGAWSWQFTSN